MQKYFSQSVLFNLMTSVDLKSPEILEQLRKKFKTLLGEDLSDQEILEKCLTFSNKHFDEFLNDAEDSRIKIFSEPYIPLEDQIQKKKPLYDSLTGILEEEYDLIKKSGKTIKDVIRESWNF